MPLNTHLATLTAIAFDVDGTLTDGRLTWSSSGGEPSAVTELKSFAFSDIMGLSLLRRLGLKLALISGEDSPQVTLFAQKLHIPFVQKGTRDKATAVRAFAEKFSLDLTHICFFGDDVNDLPAMELTGFCACPANACAEVLEFVRNRSIAGTGFVSVQNGGNGAVRSFADTLLTARNLRGRDVFLTQPPA